MSLAVLSISTRTTYIRLEVSHLIEQTEWNLLRIRQISWSIDIPIVIDAAFLHNILVCISSGDVNVFQWNRECFFSRRLKFDSGSNVMAVFEISWHGPKIISCFTRIRKRVSRWWKRPFDSPRKSTWLSPRIGWSRIKVNVLSSWPPPINFIRASPTGKMNFPFSLGNITSFALSLFWIDFRCPSFPAPQSLQPLCHPSKFPRLQAYPRNNPGKTFFPDWWILDWSFAEIG